MNTLAETIDLTSDEPNPVTAAKKQKISHENFPNQAPIVVTTPAPTAVTKTKKSTPKLKKSDTPHALIWLCTHGPNQNGSWTGKNLKIVGVYGSKQEAMNKKEQVIEENGGRGGHGDMIVGDSWSDEIALEVRPVGECTV